jgi:hypothetical protein
VAKQTRVRCSMARHMGLFMVLKVSHHVARSVRRLHLSELQAKRTNIETSTPIVVLSDGHDS